MKQVRNNVFETNSSSTHSLTICSEEEYQKWGRGEILYDDWNSEFVEPLKLTESDYTEARSRYEDAKNKYYKSWEELTDEERTEYTLEYITHNTNKYSRYLNRDQWYVHHDYLEHYEEHFTSPSGDKMVAFGYYGYDG